MTTDNTSARAGLDLDAVEARARDNEDFRTYHLAQDSADDVPALLAEVRRLRGLLDATAQAFDGLVAQVRRAAGETHEPPADVAAMLARVTALRESHRERSEALLTARRWADDAQRLLDAKEGTGREEELARQLHADAGARVTAARREGAEAMREAAARAVAAEARSADARADRCGGDSNSRRAAIEVSATCDDLADAIRARYPKPD